MSRTRKDRPNWVQEADPRNRKKARIDHMCGAKWVAVKFKVVPVTRTRFKRNPFGNIDWSSWETYEDTRRIAVLWSSEYVDCDLYDTSKPVEGHRYRSKNCGFPPQHRWAWEWSNSITTDQRKVFNRSVRGENRKTTKLMVDEYNAYGIIEDDYVFTPLPKNALFGGGYVD